MRLNLEPQLKMEAIIKVLKEAEAQGKQKSKYRDSASSNQAKRKVDQDDQPEKAE